MAQNDDLPIKRKTPHEIGQELSHLSIEELGERIGALKDEIARLEAALAGKQASRTSADRFFRR
jgi:uncharacterized small protein (DUF1192 family)